jgi:hypothetical protein
VVGESLDLLPESIPVEHLDCANQARVKLSTALLQEAAVRHLVREGVLECILEVREEPGLVKKLGGLKPVEATTERVVGQPGDHLEQRERQVLPDNRGDLQEMFVLGGESVDTCRQDRLDSRRHLESLDRLRQLVLTSLPHQRLRLHQCPDRLFQEERVSAFDQKLLEWGKLRTVS